MTLSKSNTLINKKIIDFFPEKVEKILFFNPPSIPGEYYNVDLASRGRYFCYPPYGLGVLVAHLKKNGYQSEICDLNFEVLMSLQNNNHGDFNVIDFLRPIIINNIKDFQPDVIGITSMFTMSHTFILEIAKTSKEVNSSIPILAGGVHPSNAPEMVLKESDRNIDFIMTKESELALIDLLGFVNSNKNDFSPFQISTLIEDQYVCGDVRPPPSENSLNIKPDFLRLPIGQYSSLGEVGAYFFMRGAESKASTSLSNRGCRARCTFCSVENFNGKGVRGRTIDSVIDEIEMQVNDYGINHIMWLDDDLFFDRERAINLFNEIVKRNLNITWDASNGVIASAITDELIHASADSGCIGMHVGVESGSPEILRSIRKPSGVKHYIRAGGILNKYPQIFTKGFLMVGFPSETLGQIKQTIDLAVEMDLDWYTISNLAPLPSTDIYDEMVRDGIIDDGITNTSKVNYGSSQTGKQQDIEDSQKSVKSEFSDHFEGDLEVVPDADMLDDIWFNMDYKINYEPLMSKKMADEKLIKMKKFLLDIGNRITRDNPTPFYFLGVVEEKLSNFDTAKDYYDRANEIKMNSEYWKSRFQVLGL